MGLYFEFLKTIEEGDSLRCMLLAQRVKLECGDLECLPSPIFRAVLLEDKQMLDLLIGLRIFDLDAQDPSGHTSLHRACSMGVPEIVQILLQAGANPNVSTMMTSNGDIGSIESPLHILAANESGKTSDVNCIRCLELMVEAGGNLGTLDHLGLTPLHIAAQKGNIPFIKKAIELGSQPDTLSSSNHTLLMAAVTGGHKKSVDYMLSVWRDYQFDLNATCRNGCTAVHYAVFMGNAPVLLQLLEAGASAEKKNIQGLTAYDHALSRRHPVCIDILKKEMSLL